MATRYFPPRSDAFDANGDPISGAKLYFYEAGTSTPLATYSDAALTVANSNPVIADSAGRFGEIFLLDDVAYKAVLTDASDVTIWTADPYVPVAVADPVTTAPSGFRNLLVNGQFDVNQRQLTSVADGAYCLDRWYALTNTGNVTIAQQTLQTDGIKTNIRLTQPDVTAKRLGLAQCVEAADAQPLRGSSVVLSARVRVSTSQAIRYAILSHTGTADSVTRDVVNDWTSGSYTAGNFFIAANLTVQAVGSITPNASTWTAITALTATLSSSAQNLFVIFWTETTAAQNFNLDIANVQLERGSSATNFEYLPIAQTVLRCQRFFCKTHNLDVAPTTITPAGQLGWFASAPSTLYFFNWQYPTAMRAVPTLTWYNPANGTAGQIRDASGPADITTNGANGLGQSRVAGATSATSATDGRFHLAHATADAEL